ncbi:MAG: amidohydrolase family protein [Planctomycetes bacterium]|nr:amidohydrolase family protein [Planctomycetota bacterium]
MSPNAICRTGTALAVAAALASLTCDLAAQRRGRFRRGGPPTTAGAPPEPAAPVVKKEIKNYLAIRGGTVYVGTGQVLRGATVLIGDDKILAVGPGIEIPEKAKVIDATGKCVSPGFVAVKARGMGAGSTEDDPKDSVNPFDPQIKMGLAVGITSFLSVSGFGGSMPSGSSAVFKLAYGDLDGMVLKHGHVFRMSVPLAVSQMKTFKDTVAKAKDYLEKKDAAEKAAADKPEEPKPTERPGARRPTGRRGGSQAKGPPKDLATLLDIMSGKAKLWVSCRRGYDVTNLRQALEVATLLGTGVVLEDPTVAWAIPDEVAATGSMVVLSPRDHDEPDPAQPATTGSNIAMSRILSDVGVPVAVHPPAGMFGGGGLGTGGILGQDLNTPHVDAAYAVRGGLDQHKALRTLTLDAAKIVGADSRIGSLEPGKDADILILDGDPLHYRTFVETALVNGKVVYEKSKEPFYNHIHR